MTGPRSSQKPQFAGDAAHRADPNRAIHRDFWLRHRRIGFGIFLGEAVAVIVYLSITSAEEHRDILFPMAFVWLVCAVVCLMLAPTLASRHWRAHFSAGWTVLSAFAVGVFAVLDGGIDSPLVYLLFLPIAYAALAFSPMVAGSCGLAAVISAAIVVTTPG